MTSASPSDNKNIHYRIGILLNFKYNINKLRHMKCTIQNDIQVVFITILH